MNGLAVPIMRSVTNLFTAEIVWTASPYDLQGDAQALFAEVTPQAGLERFYSALSWYDLLCRTAPPPNARPGYLLVRWQGRVVALLAVWGTKDQQWQSQTSPYSCLYAPLLAAELDAPLVRKVGHSVAILLRKSNVTTLRLDCLDPDWPPFAAFGAGLGSGGVVLLQFAHFGSWASEIAVDGYKAGWAIYHARLSGALRETIRRRRARMQRDGGFRFTLVTGGPELPSAIAAFETVYGQSWKPDEPFQTFNAEMMTLCAAHGVLRLALLWHHDTPVAAQYWLVTGGEAQVLKLAHVKTFEAFSPGTLLTAWTINQIIDAGDAHVLDFGRGDDEYKQLWVNQRRQRIGVVIANPRCRGGLMIIMRHVLGRMLRFFAA